MSQNSVKRVCVASFQRSPKHTIHWNWRTGHCGWWCCAQLRLGKGWCCFESPWWVTPALEVWMIRNQSWLLVMSLTLVERIRGPKKKRNKKKEKKKIHIYFLIYTLNKKNTQKKPTINSKNHLVLDCTKIFKKKIEEHTHTSLNALLTFMCFRRELGCV